MHKKRIIKKDIDLDRRDMSELGSNKPKVYYGKVGCLGYIIAEDEFESIEE